MGMCKISSIGEPERAVRPTEERVAKICQLNPEWTEPPSFSVVVVFKITRAYCEFAREPAVVITANL
jgi:hypothetical protein